MKLSKPKNRNKNKCNKKIIILNHHPDNRICHGSRAAATNQFESRWTKKMWLFITLLMWTTTFNAEAKRDFVIEIHEFLFNKSSPNFVKTLNYKLERPKFVTIEIALNRNVNEIELRYKFDMLKKDNKRINLLTISIDGCKGLESVYSLPLLAAITKEVLRKGNLPKRCPIQPDILYYIRNYTFNEEDYPKYTPIMSFQTLTEFYFDKQYQGFLRLRGRVRKR